MLFVGWPMGGNSKSGLARTWTSPIFSADDLDII